MKKEEKELWKEKTKGLFNILRWKTFWEYIEFIEFENKSYLKEIERLNNIIDELEKYLLEYSQDLEFRCYADTFLDKLKELKEGK